MMSRHGIAFHITDPLYRKANCQNTMPMMLLSEPMPVTNYPMDQKQASVKFESKYNKIFIQEIAFENVCKKG